ncbi:sigma-70 family RNA polymerase sigma factor [Kitasatospora sp. NPDC001539]|uniref:sigma-70 family RNA polymerase sigma factor n=1 Tax=Kitasatospora sp. NPDC001539 TaxID=3154384 RepID=UPI00332DEB4C
MATQDRNPRWDEQLRWRLARGEETALGELYDQLAPMVHGLAGRILADQGSAAQLTREVFAHVWEHPEDFDPAQGSLRSWLGALTHRRAVERLRARRAAEWTRGGGAGASEEEIRAVATAARVQYVVDSLPGPLRETIAVTYYDGRTYQETARLLGISEQAAKQRMRLGLELLATELADEAADEAADGPTGEAADGPTDGPTDGTPDRRAGQDRSEDHGKDGSEDRGKDGGKDRGRNEDGNG